MGLRADCSMDMCSLCRWSLTVVILVCWGSKRTRGQDDLTDLEGDFLSKYVLDDKKAYNAKCPLSLFEAEIKHYEKKQPPPIRLKELKKLYPGDTFEDIPTTGCGKEAEEDICNKLASEGHCTGTNVKYEKWRQTMINRDKFAEENGFHLHKIEDVSFGQINAMVVNCRQSCQNLYKDTTFEDLPSEVQSYGGFEDIIKDNFGEEIEICDLKKGWSNMAMARALSIMGISASQPKWVPRFHPVGFQKVKIPKDIYARILNNRKKILLEKKKFKLEACDAGMQNCERFVESQEAQECHIVSNENYFFRPLDGAVLDDIYTKLRPMAQDWIDNKVELAGTSIYGIRKYTRGAWLMGHLDHLKSHVISAILNVKQDVDEDWPLQIFDHGGKLHEIILKAGEMVWYESASLIHGRVKPLNGSYFENLFVHYMPRSQAWYKTDWNLDYGDPVKNITLEVLQEADSTMDKKRTELRRKRVEEEQELERQMENMNLGERMKIHSTWDK